jgi:hypothetical protein
VATTFTLANTGPATSSLKITLTGPLGVHQDRRHLHRDQPGPKKTCTVTITSIAPAASSENSQATLTVAGNNPPRPPP